MERKNGFFSEGNLPLCRFGPGGEYVTNWPGRTSAKAGKPIASVLGAMAKMLDTVINQELLANSTIEKINAAIANAVIPDFMEETSDYDKSNDFNAEAVAGTQTCGQVAAQHMLFDNAAGTGGQAGHKPNHSVRAYRKLKRKRPAFSRPWQGSLFESHQQSVKVA